MSPRFSGHERNTMLDRELEIFFKDIKSRLRWAIPSLLVCGTSSYLDDAIRSATNPEAAGINSIIILGTGAGVVVSVLLTVVDAIKVWQQTRM